MKSPNSRGQASSIVTAALALTLFASQSALAKGPKLSNQKKEQASVGTNGGGGGRVVLCPGQPPVLTDLWEAEHSTLKLVGTTVRQRLEQLRQLNPQETSDVVAANFAAYFAGENGDVDSEPYINAIQSFMSDMVDTVMGALAKPNQMQTMQRGVESSDILRVIVDTNIKDPKDSGVVKGLRGSGCVEERVAVTTFEVGGGIHNKPNITTIHIRRPDLFVKMPRLDRYALTFGHEIIHAQTEGNVGYIEGINKGPSTSERVRQLNAWIILSQEKDFQHVAFRPQENGVLNCSAASRESNKPELATRINFKFYLNPNAQDTVVELESYKNTHLWQSVLVRLPIDEKSFLIPKDINTDINFSKGESGPSFDFKMNIPNGKVQGQLKQMNLGSNFFRDSASEARETAFTLRLIQGPNQSVITQVVNSKGQVEFSGTTLCYRNEKP